jgi:RNA polymerase sigma factor for flagellar operon FliA
VSQRLRGLCELEDLLSIAKIALFNIVRSYDPDRATFATYASSKLKWAILDEVRRQTHGRSALARLNAEVTLRGSEDALDVELPPEGEAPPIEDWIDGRVMTLAAGPCQGSVDMFQVADAVASPEEEAIRVEIAGRLRRSVEALPARERALVERHYYEGEPFDQIAVSIGISKSWASRLHERAIAALGQVLRADASYVAR